MEKVGDGRRLSKAGQGRTYSAASFVFLFFGMRAVLVRCMPHAHLDLFFSLLFPECVAKGSRL